MDFLRFANNNRPSRIPTTIDAKLSSRRTISDASLATSLPLRPIATPMAERGREKGREWGRETEGNIRKHSKGENTESRKKLMARVCLVRL